MMKSYAFCEFSPNSVDVAWWPFCTFRHETLSCYKSKVKFPVSPKFHIFDKSPGLKISTCQYSVIAPPTGNGKLHVLHFNALLPRGFTTSTSNVETPEEVDDALLWVFMQRRCCGSALNFDVPPSNKKLLTLLYMVKSAPNSTHLTRVQTWRRLHGTISHSHLVSKALRPWWCFLLWVFMERCCHYCNIHHETGSCFWGVRDAQTH